MEGLHSAIAQCQKARPHISLIALLPLSLQIHGQLCRDNGLDVVGLGQCLHLHIIVHHYQHILKVSPRKGTDFHLGNGAGFQITSQQCLEDDADSGFAFASFSGQQEHFLSLGARNQAIAEELLKRQNIFLLQKLRKKGFPLHRFPGIGIVAHGETVSAKRLFF